MQGQAVFASILADFFAKYAMVFFTVVLILCIAFSSFLTRIYHKKAYCAFSCHNLAMYLEKIGKKSMTLLTAMPFQHLNSVLNL